MAVSMLVNIANASEDAVPFTSGTIAIGGIWDGALVLIRVGQDEDNMRVVARITEHDKHVQNIEVAAEMSVDAQIVNIGAKTLLTVALITP